MKRLTRSETARFLLEHDNYLILSHRRPDGDTTGSSTALCLGLRQLGKTAFVLENKEVSQRFRWLHEGLTKSAPEGNETIVSTDVASPSMLPEAFQPLLGKIALRIWAATLPPTVLYNGIDRVGKLTGMRNLTHTYDVSWLILLTWALLIIGFAGTVFYRHLREFFASGCSK